MPRRLHGRGRERTVATAARELEQRHAGQLRIKGGALVILAPGFPPPGSASSAGRDLREVVETLAAGERAILEVAGERPGRIDPESLPDRLTTPGGMLL